jgi:hypothetical protein
MSQLHDGAPSIPGQRASLGANHCTSSQLHYDNSYPVGTNPGFAAAVVNIQPHQMPPTYPSGHFSNRGFANQGFSNQGITEEEQVSVIALEPTHEVQR